MSRKALVVEDDTLLADLLAEILRQLGFEPTKLHEGKPVVEWVRQHQPDLVLLDLMLPDRNGYDICEELKLDRTTNLIPLVIVTARAQHEDKLRGLRVGANFYLTKPFGIDQLEQAINHVMEWRTELEKGGAEGEVHFQLNSDIQHLEELNHLLSSLYLFSGLTAEQVQQLTLAVREMGINAIEWGNRKQIDQPVTVTYRIDSEKVTIVIRDSGPGFNRNLLTHAAKIDDPTAHLEVRESMGIRVGGFGILMTRGLVDELQYNDAGNEVRLIKRFTPQPSETTPQK
ncbi:MAG TPA: response regulator [Tepidisphaeraceae bacterium]|jgi:DNA-binding response OmpR family regulator|nr:response regulator [Tepidisphaeraceae bacterium]